jgi:hypothetical protein
MRSERIAAAVLSGACLLAAGCSDPESFVVLSLSATTGSITGVVNIQVAVSKGMHSRMLTYPAHGAAIDQTRKTLSVGLSGGETGTVDVEIDALNDLGCSIGHGKMLGQEIKKGGVAYATVLLTPGLICARDGGADGGPEGGILPGCDPVNPQGDAGTVACMGGQTCQVDCTPPDAGAPRNECIPAGSGGPGTTCTSNADCMPGTQCFNYMNTGCPVSVCLRFCNSGSECAAFGSSGTGPGSFCEGLVMCPSVLTAYHTCTFNCDPRASAAAARGGCPAGLACVMPGAMDQVDCACAGPTRNKHDGEACASAADCAPGFICNRMGTTQVCRAICRCDASASGACAAPAGDCTSGTTCRPVTTNTIYGVCL